MYSGIVFSKAGTGYRAFIMTEGAVSFQQYLYFLQKSQKQFSTNYPKGTDPDKYTDAEKNCYYQRVDD